jgi:WD40 repeat protein
MHAIKEEPILLQFSPDNDFLIEATTRSCEDGTIFREQSFSHRFRVIAVAVSPDFKVVAFAYRGIAVQLWSLETNQQIGACGGDSGFAMISNMSPIQVVFSSDPAIELMVVTYADGNMVAYNIWSQRVVTTVEQRCHLVACSSDGHTLATASSHGVIELWDCETLRLLYRINPRGTLGKALVFMANGTRIVELRNRKVVVWEPAALDRGAAGEHACIGESGVVAELVAGEEEEEDIVSITSVCIRVRTFL